MSSPNPNDIERFVLAVSGCGEAGPEQFIRDALNLPPKTRLERQDFQQYYQDFIRGNPADNELWERMHDVHNPTSTKGFISNFFFGADEEKVPAPAAAAPSKPAVVQDPLTTRRAGTINAPVWPKGIDRQKINSSVDERMKIQRRQPWVSAWDGRAPQQQASMVMRPDPIAPARVRMNNIPCAPRGNLVRVQPQWDPRLEGMRIIDHKMLPRELIVDDVTLAEMDRTESFQFPRGPSCPMRVDAPIPRSMVQFRPIDRNQASIEQYMDEQGPEYCSQVYQPPWVQQSIACGRRSLTNSMQRMSMSHTAAKSGSHSVRAMKHTKAKAELDELIRGKHTVY